MAWRSSIARSIHCGAAEREKISALIIYTIRSLANKLTLCSPMHDLLGLRIRGRVTGPPEVIPVLCRQWTWRFRKLPRSCRAPGIARHRMPHTRNYRRQGKIGADIDPYRSDWFAALYES